MLFASSPITNPDSLTGNDGSGSPPRSTAMLRSIFPPPSFPREGVCVMAGRAYRPECAADGRGETGSRSRLWSLDLMHAKAAADESHGT